MKFQDSAKSNGFTDGNQPSKHTLIHNLPQSKAELTGLFSILTDVSLFLAGISRKLDPPESAWVNAAMEPVQR